MTTLRASAEHKALRHPKFVLYWIAIGCASFAVQIMSVSVGWEIYDITRDPLYLGYVGLVQFLPPLLLVLVTGLAADRFNRRLIMASCLALEAVCALGLLLFTLSKPTDVTPVFGILAVESADAGQLAAVAVAAATAVAAANAAAATEPALTEAGATAASAASAAAAAAPFFIHHITQSQTTLHSPTHSFHWHFLSSVHTAHTHHFGTSHLTPHHP
jgi:MFS family permease